MPFERALEPSTPNIDLSTNMPAAVPRQAGRSSVSGGKQIYGLERNISEED
jgi:hypothetical protein